MLSSPSLFTAPAGARESKPADGYIQPTLNHGLRIWWAYFWPTTLIAGVLQFCAGFWLRLMYDRLVIDAHTLKDGILTAPYLTTAAIGLLIFRYILGKRFRHFRLALLPAASLSDAAPLRPIWRRTVRIWWTFTWRSLVYALIAFVIVTLPLSWFLGIFRPSPAFASFFFLSFGTVVNAAISLFIIYSNILDEEFGDFRVVLLPREPAPKTPLAAGVPPQAQATA
jgi:hypothetical protein